MKSSQHSQQGTDYDCSEQINLSEKKVKDLSKSLPSRYTLKKYSWKKDGNYLLNSNKTNFNKNEKKILRILLKLQMPMEYRKKYWMNVSGASTAKNNNKDYYHNILHNYPDYIPSSFNKEIINDLQRTFPNESFFQEKQTLDSMYNILLAYSRRNSTIGYCQGFNFIVGRLLEITGDEEDTFWIFVQVIETILPVEHYAELSGVMCDCAIIIPFIAEIVPDVYNHLISNGFEITLNTVLYKWFVSLLLQGMHKDIWLPFWDLFLLDGYTVLFKAIIIILKLAKDKIMKLDTMFDINDFFETKLNEFTHQDFINLLVKDKKFIKTNYLITRRKETLPKIIDTIKQSKARIPKQNTDEDEIECNHDWPVCVKQFSSINIEPTLTLRTNEPIQIEDNCFSLNNAKLRSSLLQSTIIENTQNDFHLFQENQSYFYGNLLIQRQEHSCKAMNSTKNEIINKNNSKEINGGFKENNTNGCLYENTLRASITLRNERQTCNYHEIITRVKNTYTLSNLDDAIIRRATVFFDLETNYDDDNNNDNNHNNLKNSHKSLMKSFIKKN